MSKLIQFESKTLPRVVVQQRRPRPQKSESDSVHQAQNMSEIIERGIPLFPLKRRCKLNYFDSFSITTGAGAAGNYVISCNGLFDPNITGTGHQPMGFDQMMLSYDHYVVHSAKLTVQIHNTGSTYAAHVGVYLSPSSTAPTSIQQIVENGTIVRDWVDVATNAFCQKTLQISCDVGKYEGVPNVLNDPELRGSISSNPLEQSFFTLTAFTTETTNTTLVWCDCFVEYDATFAEPRKNSLSLNQSVKKQLLEEDRQKRQSNKTTL